VEALKGYRVVDVACGSMVYVFVGGGVEGLPRGGRGVWVG
jgi:hypothetical protein